MADQQVILPPIGRVIEALLTELFDSPRGMRLIGHKRVHHGERNSAAAEGRNGSAAS